MCRLIVIVLLLTGCATRRPIAVPRSEQGSDASTVRAQMLVAGARTDLDSAAPYVMVGGVQYLTAAVEKLVRANIELVQAREVIRWWSNAWSDQETKITRQDEKLRAYHNQWVGDKLKRWFWAVVLGWAALGALSALFGGFFLTGPIAWISRAVIRALPFSGIFSRGRDAIIARGGTVVTTRNAVGSTVSVLEQRAENLGPPQ